MFLVVRTPRKTTWGPSLTKLGDIKKPTGEAGIATTGESPLPVLAWGVSAISGIRLGLHWKFRTPDEPFGFLVFKLSGVRFAEVSFRNYLDLLEGLRWYIYSIC